MYREFGGLLRNDEFKLYISYGVSSCLNNWELIFWGTDIFSVSPDIGYGGCRSFRLVLQ